MTVCDDSDFYDDIKKCPECGGDVHSHLIDINLTSEGDEHLCLSFHCHKCGEYFEDDEFWKMEDHEVK